MGTAVGLVCGVGLLLVCKTLTAPARTKRGPNQLHGRLRVLLQSAAITTVSPAGLISLMLLGGLLVGLVLLIISRTPPVALTFATLAAYAPVAIICGRVRRRRRTPAEESR